MAKHWRETQRRPVRAVCRQLYNPGQCSCHTDTTDPFLTRPLSTDHERIELAYRAPVMAFRRGYGNTPLPRAHTEAFDDGWCG
jgi:hypothetical protein